MKQEFDFDSKRMKTAAPKTTMMFYFSSGHLCRRYDCGYG
jgi:hypothetical protein